MSPILMYLGNPLVAPPLHGGERDPEPFGYFGLGEKHGLRLHVYAPVERPSGPHPMCGVGLVDPGRKAGGAAAPCTKPRTGFLGKSDGSESGAGFPRLTLDSRSVGPSKV